MARRAGGARLRWTLPPAGDVRSPAMSGRLRCRTGRLWLRSFADFRARARGKITELEAALEGAEFFTPAHAALLAAMLGRIDRVDKEIAALTEVIERLLAPHEEQLQQAESMPGWGRRSAEDTIAETGVDMTRFPTPAHLASWAGRTPLDNSSGKRTGRARYKKGNRYLAAITGETAVAAGKTQTREGARYRKIRAAAARPRHASPSATPS